jgi:hypothetical protein
MFRFVKTSPWCLLLLVTDAVAFSPSPTTKRIHGRRIQASLAEPAAELAAEKKLTALFPSLATSLDKLGFSTPTPIQAASAARALDGENLLLIAPTGSGKTLAYLAPALEKALSNDGTVLVVVPTRELAVQLARDASSLLDNLEDNNDAASVIVSLRGFDLPTSEQLSRATVLIGTPPELVKTLRTNGAQKFLAGDRLRAVVLDEVDVLLPLPPKGLRTTLDTGSRNAKAKEERSRNTPQDERRRQEQKRKLNAMKRQGVQISTGMQQAVSPTEQLLQLVVSYRFVGGDKAGPPQILAGSATASRRTLDRLNRALKAAAQEGTASSRELVWSGDVKACRPEFDSDSEDEEEAPVHTIRAVTVPAQVTHKYVALSKEAASSGVAVLSAVAKAASVLKPQTALVFLCGEFGKSNVKQKDAPQPETKGKTSQARRDSFRKRRTIGDKKAAVASTGSSTESISARMACATLGKLGIEAQVSFRHAVFVGCIAVGCIRVGMQPSSLCHFSLEHLCIYKSRMNSHCTLRLGLS